MTNTPNHNYNTPSEGTTNWHIPLNENFHHLDTDVEIRDTEENRQNYDPKQGAKYEAIDSGAVYYGDGDTWVLADRQVNVLRAGKLFKNTYPGSAIVAPSVPSAYDKIQHAIDDGFRDVWLCEDVEESGITLPENTDAPTRQPFRLSGMAQHGRPVINDPQNGDPVILKDEGDAVTDAILQNFKIRGGVDSVEPINLLVGGANTTSRPAGYILRNIRSKGGAWRIGAGRHRLINCSNKNISDISNVISGVEMWPSITTTGATFAMYSGTWTATKGDHNTRIGSGAFSITGGVTFTNFADGDNPDSTTYGAADLTFQGASRGFIGGISCESADVDIRMGMRDTDTNPPGLNNSVIAGPSYGGGDAQAKIEVNQPSYGVTIMNVGNDTKVKKTDRGTLLFMCNAGTDIEVTGGHPQDVTQIAWGVDGQFEIGNVDGSYTQFKEDIVSSEPDYPKAGASIIADGKNWDPQGTGNAAKVIYNGSEWVVDTDLGTPL